jgi:ribonuclease P protein component
VGGPAERALPKQPHGNALEMGQRPFGGRFPKAARLRSRSDFSRVKTSSERVVTRHFVFLLSRQSPPLTLPRLGVTASRKVGTAVVRNRAKRLVREAFRATSPTLWTPGVDIVVIVRNIDAETRLQDVIAEWESARAKLLSRMREFSRAATSASVDVQSTHRTSRGTP